MLCYAMIHASQSNWLDYSLSLVTNIRISVLRPDILLPNVFPYEVLSGIVRLSSLYY